MNWMKTTKIFGLVLFLVSMLSFSVAALPVTFQEVHVDGTEVSAGTVTVLASELNGNIDVRVELASSEDLRDVQVEAVMRGYDHNDLIDDISDAFDMTANVTYVKKLTLKLPIRMDKDTYSLRIRAENRAGATSQVEYLLKVEAPNHDLWVKDVVLNPEGYVKAGRALLTTIRVKNIGEQDEEGIKIRSSIPALGISASDYIDEIKEGESTTSEELYMRIPACAETGEYTLKVDVTYDDGDETETLTKTIDVVSGDTCPGTSTGTEDNTESPAASEKTTLTVGATTQDVVAGQGGSIYPLTITNMGSVAKTYSVSVDLPGNWGTYQVSPSNVAVVDAGETTTMFVYVSANDNAQAGENLFTVTVSADGEELKQVMLKANVAEGASSSGWEKVKGALQIGLVVLVVLLVILGLVIGFQRLKGDDRDNDDMGKTYY